LYDLLPRRLGLDGRTSGCTGGFGCLDILSAISIPGFERLLVPAIGALGYRTDDRRPSRIDHLPAPAIDSESEAGTHGPWKWGGPVKGEALNPRVRIVGNGIVAAIEIPVRARTRG
jgi:hypothetical protein